MGFESLYFRGRWIEDGYGGVEIRRGVGGLGYGLGRGRIFF